MKQQINVQITFSDGGQTVEIQNVYEHGNLLIAVATIKPSGQNTEAVTKRKDTVTVETGHEQSLQVKHYIVNDLPSRLRTVEISNSYRVVNSSAQMPELSDARTLPLERAALPSRVSIAAAMFSNGLQASRRHWIGVTNLMLLKKWLT